MQKKKSYPARLHVVFAAEKSLAVVFRRGPSKAVCTFLWDRQKDKFTIGQWLKGRIYERRSDLSPDGQYLLYFAMNGKWFSETAGAWTAISRAPYLKAIELYKKGDCWEGGGLFLSKNSYWLNDRYYYDEAFLRKSNEVKALEGYVPEGGYGGTVDGIYFNAEDTGVYYRKLIRDGWIHKKVDKQQSGSKYTFEKTLPKNWILRKHAHEGGSSEGKSCYWDEHSLVNTISGKELLCSDWEWAEQDQGDIVWASKGILYRANILSNTEIGQAKALYDFNGCTFEDIIAPY